MNNKRFGKLPKQRPLPTASISFHSSKIDDEEHQLEFSYSKVSEETDDINKSSNLAETGQQSGQTEKETSLKANAKSQENFSSLSSLNVSENTHDTLQSINEKKLGLSDSLESDSVRDHLSQSNRRPYSFESESSLLAKSEGNGGWPLLREIKGKITKTLEERISKDSKGKLTTSEKISTIPKQDTNSSEIQSAELSFEILTPNTPSDTDSDKTNSINLSPAVEASEFMTEEGIFNINEKFESEAKCEIMSSKSHSGLSSSLSKGTSRSKSDVSMSLSSLMINRIFSYEDDSTKKNLEEKEDSSKVEIVAENIIDSNLESNLDQKNSIFNKLALNIKYFIIPSQNRFILHLLIVIFAYMVNLVSSWLSGFIVGIVLACTMMWWLLKPREPRKEFKLPNYESLPSMTSPNSDSEDEPIIYKGWMNELLCEYNPNTYHVNSTQSVYIRLDGSFLRVSYPKNNIPKRAMFNEPRHEQQFVDQRHHDLTGAIVELLPDGLASKRLWSKKYPIRLTIPNPKKMDTMQPSKVTNLDDSVTTAKSFNPKDNPIKKFVPMINKDNDDVMYLFSRTNREKDIWFNRFKTASKMKMLKSHSPSSSINLSTFENALENKRTMSMDLASISSSCSVNSTEEESDDEIDTFVDVKLTKELKFSKYMSQLLSPLHLEQSFSQLSYTPTKGRHGFMTSKSKSNPVSQYAPTHAWLNVLIGRIFFDFLTEDVWAKAVSERIQRKLNKIKLPNFLEGLTIKDINLGESLPKMHRTSEPIIDQRGLWIDIDLSYNGSFQMTLETKLNLFRMSKSDSEDFSLHSVTREKKSLEHLRDKSHIYNDEDDDTAESSSDEDLPLIEVSEGPNIEESSTILSQAATSSTGKKIIRLMDRLAQSSYFQNATKYKYIKRAMEEVSNTPIVLTVEIHWLTGTLAINIPPMPTDRLWYGFRKNPDLSILARPKLGQHAVTITHVTEWIEKKLVSEFQKILVMPNMDDLIIPIMLSNEDLPKT